MKENEGLKNKKVMAKNLIMGIDSQDKLWFLSLT